MNEREINGYRLEICANSLYSAKQAQAGGASRVELCQNLENGGTTASYGLMKLTREALTIGVHVLIRPRTGDFLYSPEEFEEIKQDIVTAKALQCNGVVIGILTPDGDVDKLRMQELVALAKPMCVVFHRAFDRCRNPFQALEDIISLGCDRILTSGQMNAALQGKELLKELIQKADGRIEIMPGAGVQADNVKEILLYTGAKSIHSSAKVVQQSEMNFQIPTVTGMDENLLFSSSSKVAEIVDQIKSL